MRTEKTIAVMDIVKEGRSERMSTTAGAKRVAKACRTLGLDKAETIEVMQHLDIVNSDGDPYVPTIKRSW